LAGFLLLRKQALRDGVQIAPGWRELAARFRRKNSSIPNSASSALICAVSVGWLTFNAAAPATKPPALATAWNDLSCVKFIDTIYR
jgi:hypothetical protein